MVVESTNFMRSMMRQKGVLCTAKTCRWQERSDIHTQDIASKHDRVVANQYLIMLCLSDLLAIAHRTCIKMKSQVSFAYLLNEKVSDGMNNCPVGVSRHSAKPKPALFRVGANTIGKPGCELNSRAIAVSIYLICHGKIRQHVPRRVPSGGAGSEVF